ncbi:FadR/GntR family transcriptional regulator [Sediminicurvatus halobius]|uniref:FadR/GntR family transcriptional regulator n=1 Tax=Sediminicurvatus halobius TaxID=2182432 RepID=UPI001304AAF1|nr:FCD domain-containing protein [Spiribacter halobius]UEX77840.1 FCD domain-containing protein [Spiribacter halobius]
MSEPDDDLFGRLKAVVLTAQTSSDGRIRLPAERRLAEQLGVQRSTVRERLATLENLGFIERTPGSGTYVQMPKPGFVQLYFDLAVRLGYVSVDQMEEAREMLEREIARQAAIRATDDDVAALAELRDRILHAETIADGLRADHEFHMRLAYTTRNPVIILMIQGLSTVLREVVHQRRVRVRQVPRGAERTNATHIPIVEAIAARDPIQAVAAMDKHFRVWDEESARVLSARPAKAGSNDEGTASDD